jgi:hypothetical protein
VPAIIAAKSIAAVHSWGIFHVPNMAGKSFPSLAGRIREKAEAIRRFMWRSTTRP